MGLHLSYRVRSRLSTKLTMKDSCCQADKILTNDEARSQECDANQCTPAAIKLLETSVVRDGNSTFCLIGEQKILPRGCCLCRNQSLLLIVNALT